MQKLTAYQESMAPPGMDSPQELYLDLLKRCLTRSLLGDTYRVIAPKRGSLQRVTNSLVQGILARWGLVLARLPDPSHSPTGPSMWSQGETMMGIARLNNIQSCAIDVIRRGVPGDFIETGVWRGGGPIFMRAILKAYGDTSRKVWVADSFRGLPPPDAHNYPADAGNEFWREDRFAVPVERVKQNFARYDLLDSQVEFLVGWFRDTLPQAPIEQLALVRLDGDLYESTMDGLRNLYPKLSRGGYIIVDDYGWVPNCKAAVEDFRKEHGIRETISFVEDHERSCAYWQKAS